MGNDKIIDTGNHPTTEWNFDQTTLVTPSKQKYWYTALDSVFSKQAKKYGWEVKTVHYFGACESHTINSCAHSKMPTIQINGVNVADFIDKLATEDEFIAAFKR